MTQRVKENDKARQARMNGLGDKVLDVLAGCSTEDTLYVLSMVMGAVATESGVPLVLKVRATAKEEDVAQRVKEEDASS